MPAADVGQQLRLAALHGAEHGARGRSFADADRQVDRQHEKQEAAERQGCDA